MTQYPTPENVRGNFANVTLQFDNDIYRLQYACHLSRVGRPMPPWLVEEAEVAGT